MSRYRPPSPPRSPYITRAGYGRLEAELANLWDRRTAVVDALAAAAAEGDRSENAEYIYRKKELREIDRRVGYLQRRLPGLRIVDPARSEACEQVFFGARVSLEGADGARLCVRLVGADEIAPGEGDISIDSPLGRVLLRRVVGDTVRVEIGDDTREYVIDAVVYDTPGTRA